LEGTLDLLATALGVADVARLQIAPAEALLESVGPASHHHGGTRMAGSPHTGVVDADCGVCGVSGLWVAGGAVFPTVGFANPTLTIVALALRLADHLAGRRT
jgi:choline dehydrogenase-like flavoprotein